MNRRSFLVSAAALCIPLPAQAAYQATSYRRGMIAELQAQNRPVILNYTASWSYTCEIKRNIIAKLKSDNSAYRDLLTFVDIDWDTYGPSQMAQRWKVERHCTLISFKGETELARLVAVRDEIRIKTFLDQALAA